MFARTQKMEMKTQIILNSSSRFRGMGTAVHPLSGALCKALVVLWWWSALEMGRYRVDGTSVTSDYNFEMTRNGVAKACGAWTFSPLQMACVGCPSGSEVSKQIFDGEQNYVECICSPGYFSSTGSTPCTACDSSEGTTQDRTSCLPCDSTTTGVSWGRCTCGSVDSVIVDSDAAGNKLTAMECITCPSGTLVITSDTTIAGKTYYADYWSCQSCPDPLMTMSYSGGTYSCSCPSDYTLVGDTVVGAQSCILTSTISSYTSSLSTVSTITFNNGQTVTSATISHYFLKSVSQCLNFVEGVSADLNSCSALANLCVLTLYSTNTGGICDILLTTVTATRTLFRYFNWYTDAPWLTYGSATSTQVCDDEGYKKRILLTNGLLDFYLAKFSMNGTWMGISPLSGGFGYCPVDAPFTSAGGGASSDTQYQEFAQSRINVFNCQMSRLLDYNSPDQYFYELYIKEPGNKIYPVPVRIVGLDQGGTKVNLLQPSSNKLCDTSDVLVRRFYLTDVSTGIEDSSSSYTDGQGVGRLAPTVLRYAKTISLAVSLVSKERPHIYAPVLTVEYAEMYSSDISDTTTEQYTVQSQYYKPMTEFFTYVRQFFIAGMVIMGLVAFLRYSNWSKRNTRAVSQFTTTTNLSDINFTSLAKILLLCMHSWVLVFFPFVVLIAWYLFVFFKMQEFPSVMLPPVVNIYSTSSEYFMFVAALHILAFFQFGYVCFLILKQSYADVFFIDWEPATAKADGGGGRVSVWRSILVGNEWAELLVQRRTDVRFTLFFILFLYYGESLQYDASQQPDLSDKSAAAINPVLRFATNVWWWLLFSTGQYYFNYLFYNRFISEPPEQVFVDLCTIAKISILGLDEDYHGFYLHCRSPHQFADGTMLELLDMLQKEEAGLTVDRSLEGAPKDVQTFEVFMSGEWRQAFDKSFQALKTPASVTDMMHQGRRGRPGPGMGRYIVLREYM
jgi:meckelin